MDSQRSRERHPRVSGFLTIAATLLALAATPAMAGDWYASPTGSDSNDCLSAASACQTIQAAIDKAGANDTVHVGAGTYPFASNRIHITTAGLQVIGANSPFDKIYGSGPGEVAPMTPNQAADASVLAAATAPVPGGTTSAMIWVDNVPDVRIENLYIEKSVAAFEAIVATGHVNGLAIVNNYIKFPGGNYGAVNNGMGISVNREAGSDSSVPASEPRVDGAFVTIQGNVLEPTKFTAFGSYPVASIPKRAIMLRHSVGLIEGNQVIGARGDLWISEARTDPGHPPAQRTLTVRNNWCFGALQLPLDGQTGGLSAAVAIEGNHFIALDSAANPFADITSLLTEGWIGDGSHAGSVVLMGQHNFDTIVRSNQFIGFHDQYRGLWLKQRNRVIVEDNQFTPEAGASDYTAVLVGIRWDWSSGHRAPAPYGITLLGNSFHGSGAVPNTGKAIAFVNDNDAGGTATGGTAAIGDGTPANANSFDSNIAWYIVLDDRSCPNQIDHDIASCAGTTSYPIGAGVAYGDATSQTSDKAPFEWDLNAHGNSFDGVFMAAMTTGQFNAVRAKVWDTHTVAVTPAAAEYATPANVGEVAFAFPPATSGTIQFSPTGFTWDGSPHAITASLQEDPGASCSVTPATVTDVGDTQVQATCLSAAYNVSDSATVHVAKATGTLAWGTISWVYDGATHAVSASIAESGEPCTVTPPSIGPDVTSATLNANCNGSHYSASGSTTAAITQASQSIAFDTTPPANPVYGGSYVVAASATSGLTVHLAVAAASASVCSLTGSTLSFTGVGTCTLNATQSGNTNYAAAMPVQQSFAVAKATGTLAWGTTSWVYDGAAHAVSASIAESGEPCTVTPPGIGPDVISATVNANCNGSHYSASGSTTAAITQATGTLVWDTTSFVYSGSQVTPSAHIAEEPAATCHFNPAQVGPAAGSYGPVQATCTGSNYSASGSHAVEITPQPVTLVLVDLTQAYDASPKPITVQPAGVDVSITYNGSAAAPTQVGDYAVVVSDNDPDYSADQVSGVLHIIDAAQISLTVTAAPAMGLVGSHAPYSDMLQYSGVLANAGGLLPQAVFFQIEVVRIDDGNHGGAPMPIDRDDVRACVRDTPGYHAQADHHGCRYDSVGLFGFMSLYDSQHPGSENGRDSSVFSYTNLLPPPPGSSIAFQAVELAFKPGDYKVFGRIVGSDDGHVYATAVVTTTVPDAAISYAGPHSGQVEATLNAQSTLSNNGGPVDGNVRVRVTLSDDGGAPLAPGDVNAATQVGSNFLPLTWTPSGNDLVTWFGPASGFPLPDGYHQTTSLQAVFHRQGNYHLSWDVLDAATASVLFTSSSEPMVIGANQVAFTLSNLVQVYDGSPKPVTVDPGVVPHTVIYEAKTGPSCPTTPTGANTTAPTNAGPYCVYVSADAPWSGNASGVLTVQKAPATVALDDTLDGTDDGVIHRTFDSNPQAVTATTNPASLGYSVTYDGGAAPTAAGSYVVVAAVTDPNYSGSPAFGILDIVPAPTTDVEVGISDNRSHARYGQVLTWFVRISNVGNQDATDVSVDDVLPATLLAAAWECVEVQATAHCDASSGTGELHTTVDLPQGTSALFIIDTVVNADQGLATDVLVNSVDIAAAGDSNAANDTATDTTQAVILRDGFELGGNGAQVIARPGSGASAMLGDRHSHVIGLDPAWASHGAIVELARLTSDRGDRIRVQAVHAGHRLLVRMLGRVAGQVRRTHWLAVAPDTRVLVAGLVDAGEHEVLLLQGPHAGVQIRLPATGSLELRTPDGVPR